MDYFARITKEHEDDFEKMQESFDCLYEDFFQTINTTAYLRAIPLEGIDFQKKQGRGGEK